MSSIPIIGNKQKLSNLSANNLKKPPQSLLVKETTSPSQSPTEKTEYL